MIKELKNLFYIIVIFLFIFFTGKYYFSDSYKKKSYRAINLVKENSNIDDNNLIILKSDTENIIEYIENTIIKKKKHSFWNLLIND